MEKDYVSISDSQLNEIDFFCKVDMPNADTDNYDGCGNWYESGPCPDNGCTDDCLMAYD